MKTINETEVRRNPVKKLTCQKFEEKIEKMKQFRNAEKKKFQNVQKQTLPNSKQTH